MLSTPNTPVRDLKDVEENKDLAALSYAWVMAPVLLLSKKRSAFVHFHAKQGAVLFALSLLFIFIPYANRFFELVIFLLMVWGFLDAAQGKWTELPLVGALARGKFTVRGSWKQTVAAIVSARHWCAGLWTHHDRLESSGTTNQAPGTNIVPATFPLQPSVHQDIPLLDPESKIQ
jgi:uncharacterized membrane protein